MCAKINIDGCGTVLIDVMLPHRPSTVNVGLTQGLLKVLPVKLMVDVNTFHAPPSLHKERPN